MTAWPGVLIVVITLAITFPFVALLGGGIWWCWRSIKKAKEQRQQMEDTPLVKVNEVTSGLQKIRGKIRAEEPDEPLRSPLARKKCVYYRFLVQEHRSSRHGRHTTHHWVTIVDDKNWVDFTIADKTGEADIDMNSAEVTLTTKAKSSSGTFDDPSPELESLMRNRYGKSTQGLIFNRNLRYTESYLRDGDTVMVIGDVKKTRGRLPAFTKGEHHLVLTDMQEKELAQAYGTKSILFWILFGFLCFFLVMTCGAGGVGVAVGIGAAVVGSKIELPEPHGPGPGFGPGPGPKQPKVNANPKPIDPTWDEKKMKPTFLNDMQEQNVKLGWGRFGKNGKLGYGMEFGQDDAQISIRGQAKNKAISFHPPDSGESSVQYRLERQYKLFLTQVVFQDFPAGVENADTGLIFKVYGDNELLWISDAPLRNRNDVQSIRISVENVDVLELRVHCPGNKRHAWPVWVGPRVLK